MREKYFLSEEQYSKMEVPTLRGTKLNMVIRSLNFGPLGKTLLGLHQQARDVGAQDPSVQSQKDYEVVSNRDS